LTQWSVDLIESAMKVVERIFEYRIRQKIETGDIYEYLFALLVQKIKYSKSKYNATESKVRNYKKIHAH